MNRIKIKSTLLKSLHAAGALLKSSIHRRQTVSKKGKINIVTEIDKRAEKMILSIILKTFPDHAILAEESLGQGESPFRWIIDPLDGTTNFAHRFPFACVSIAFEAHGRMEMGGVFDPFRNELFFAERGKGAFLNRKGISVSKTTQLVDCLLATGFPYDVHDNPGQYLTPFKEFLIRVQGIRRAGAAALDLCYVACGRFDGFWEAKLNAWDCAAAALIVEEAGGKMTNYAGEKFDIAGFKTVASNGRIHSEMLKIIKRNL